MTLSQTWTANSLCHCWRLVPIVNAHLSMLLACLAMMNVFANVSLGHACLQLCQGNVDVNLVKGKSRSQVSYIIATFTDLDAAVQCYRRFLTTRVNVGGWDRWLSVKWFRGQV